MLKPWSSNWNICSVGTSEQDATIDLQASLILCYSQRTRLTCVAYIFRYFSHVEMAHMHTLTWKDAHSAGYIAEIARQSSR